MGWGIRCIHRRRAELERHGICCEGKRAVQLKTSDYDEYDYLIGMDSMNIRNMERMTGHRCEVKRFMKLLEFAGSRRQIAGIPGIPGRLMKRTGMWSLDVRHSWNIWKERAGSDGRSCF